MTRVALDLLGGDGAPETVVDGALLAVQRWPDVELLLVGPTELAEQLLSDRDAAGRFRIVPATGVIGMDEPAAAATRARPDATVRVAAGLVRDGSDRGGADAFVSAGSSGATLTAAVSVLGCVDGLHRAPLAGVLPALTGPIVLLDVGAVPDPTPQVLAQLALLGAAFASIRFGLPAPRVGLLSIGEEPGKGDALRQEAYDVLSRLPLDFVGNVEGGDVPCGGRADVVVTDGFTGNVLAKTLEGSATASVERLRDALPEGSGLLPLLEETALQLSADRLGGGVVLGVKGVVVVGHGACSAEGIASCVGTAVQAVREGLVPRIARDLRQLLTAAPAEVVG